MTSVGLTTFEEVIHSAFQNITGVNDFLFMFQGMTTTRLPTVSPAAGPFPLLEDPAPETQAYK